MIKHDCVCVYLTFFLSSQMHRQLKGSNRPIEVRIQEHQRQRARQRTQEDGKKISSSGYSTGQNRFTRVFVGLLGEEIVADYLGLDRKTDTQHYDFRTRNNVKIEVKTKKTKDNRMPKPHFEASFCDRNKRQRCDYYVFVRVSVNYEKAWILGQCHKQDFLIRAVRFKKGDYDPRNNYRVHTDCFNMYIADLNDINLLKGI